MEGSSRKLQSPSLSTSCFLEESSTPCGYLGLLLLLQAQLKEWMLGKLGRKSPSHHRAGKGCTISCRCPQQNLRRKGSSWLPAATPCPPVSSLDLQGRSQLPEFLCAFRHLDPHIKPSSGLCMSCFLALWCFSFRIESGLGTRFSILRSTPRSPQSSKVTAQVLNG